MNNDVIFLNKCLTLSNDFEISDYDLMNGVWFAKVNDGESVIYGRSLKELQVKADNLLRKSVVNV